MEGFVLKYQNDIWLGEHPLSESTLCIHFQHHVLLKSKLVQQIFGQFMLL